MADKKESARAQGKTALLRQLTRVHEIDRQIIAAGGMQPDARLLVLWQTRRLEQTYADFVADEHYSEAIKFFVNDLYGPANFAQRDADLEKVLPIMSKILPNEALEALTWALELQALSRDLDAQMLTILVNELGMDGMLDAESWAQAYRRCGRPNDRARQIELVAEAGRLLDRVVRRRLVYGLVVLARGPAHAAGFADLQGLVERGFKAFRELHGAEQFIAEIELRETDVMQTLFAGKTPVDWNKRPGKLSLADLNST